jgi:hypothetical protein
MTDQGIVVLGIPIPSTSPVFLSIVAVHVIAGLICTIAGVVAMLAPKRHGRHPAAGTTYYWSLVVVFVSMTALSILRWPANNHLFVLGIASFGAAVVGRMAKRRAGAGWLRVHVTGMGISYVLLLTAFYVDNGPHLPLWRSLPPVGALGPPERSRRSHLDLGTWPTSAAFADPPHVEWQPRRSIIESGLDPHATR